MSYEVAELQRKLADMIQITTITSVDHANKKLRVRLGADESAELPWPASIGRNFIAWKPLRVGQQVILFSPSGDPAQGVIIGDLYSQAIDSPSTAEEIDLVEFEDGSRLYVKQGGGVFVDSAGALAITVAGNASIRVSGYAQIIASGRMLIKSLTRLILKGPRATIVL